MSEIICECGHDCKNHDNNGCTWWVEHKDKRKKLPCQCTLSAMLVEARYWARHYYTLFQQSLKDTEKVKYARDNYHQWYLEAKDELFAIRKERDALKEKLEFIHDGLLEIMEMNEDGFYYSVIEEVNKMLDKFNS